MNFSSFYRQIVIIFLIGISFSATEDNIFYSESWALLIGINNYQNEPHLNYAVADAERMHKLLTETLDFPRDNVSMLLDKEATLVNIKKEMRKLYELAQDNDRVLIYFAGHGITESLPSEGEEGYLVPVEGDRDDLYTTSLPMSEMKRISDRVAAKDMLFLMDACYSGLMGVGNRGLSLDAGAKMSLKKIAAGGSRTVITAGKKGEIAQERSEWGHSPFVKNLISGLEKGMADNNDDGYITDTELGQYLTYQVTADTDNKQTPVISRFTTDQGQFVFIIGDVDISIRDANSKSSTTVELDYDKLADKIADRMGSNQPSISEEDDGELAETDIETDSKSKRAEELEELKEEKLVLDDEMEALNDEMEALNDEMEALNDEMEDLNDEIDEAEELEEGKNETIAHLKAQIGEVGGEIGRVGGEIGRVGGEIGKVGGEIGRVADQIEKLEKLVEQEEQEDVDEAVDELFAALNKLGIEVEAEEIAKLGEDMGNKITGKLGLAEGELIANCTFSRSPIRHFADEPEDEEDMIFIDDISNNNWWRYNRSEGLFFQLNRVFQSSRIQGSSFYGGIGRAFHRNEYQGILGLEQLIFNNIFQFYAEAFDKSITNDAWRLWDGANSLSTVFRRQDYLDWYRGSGFRTAGFVHIKNYVSIGAEYNTMLQSEMGNVLEGDKFRAPYNIQEGYNVFVKTIISAGYPIELSIRDKFQMYSTLIRTSSIGNSDISSRYDHVSYNYDHVSLNLLIPYSKKLSFNIKLMAGASDVDSSIWYDKAYYQNVFEIGGEGTLRGYDWKSLRTSHYQLTNLEVWSGSIGVFYDRAVLFGSQGNVFNGSFLGDLFQNLNRDKSSIGFIYGSTHGRLTFAKGIGSNNPTTMYFTFGAPLQYW